MMNQWKRLLFLCSLLIVGLLPNTAQSASIFDSLNSSSEFETLTAAIQVAGLQAELSGSGPFTLFAPPDAAFEQVFDNLGLSASELLNDTELLTAVLTFHVVEGALFSENLSAGDATTLNGAALTVNLTNGVQVNQATVTTPDVEVSNGVIHVIDAVLLPPDFTVDTTEVTPPMPTPVQPTPVQPTPVQATPTFIPTATPMLTATPVPTNTPDVPQIARLRTGHFSPDAPAVDIYVNGDLIEGGLSFGSASQWREFPSGATEIVITEAGAALDDPVLDPINLTFTPDTWSTIAVIGSLANNTLTTQLIIENYSSALPDDDARVLIFHAIEGAPAVDILANETRLIADLAYPGTAGNNDGAASRDVDAGTYNLQITVANDAEGVILTPDAVTLNGGRFYLLVAAGTPDTPQLQIIEATPADVITGDADGLDTQTSQPSAATTQITEPSAVESMTDDANTLFDVASQTTGLGTFVAAVEAAGLVDSLVADASLTVFAPSDSAFTGVLAELGIPASELFNETALLTQILTYHILEAERRADALLERNGQTLTTRNGDTIAVDVDALGILLNESALVTSTDLLASNGVLHIINQVLLPPSLEVGNE